ATTRHSALSGRVIQTFPRFVQNRLLGTRSTIAEFSVREVRLVMLVIDVILALQEIRRQFHPVEMQLSWRLKSSDERKSIVDVRALNFCAC
ncbi:hypothetical protein, partial [Xanthomonas hortorum]